MVTYKSKKDFWIQDIHFKVGQERMKSTIYDPWASAVANGDLAITVTSDALEVNEKTSVDKEAPKMFFKVTFDGMDGNPPTVVETEAGSNVLVPCINDNELIVGWSLDEKGKKLFDVSTPIVKDLTLFAVYE